MEYKWVDRKFDFEFNYSISDWDKINESNNNSTYYMIDEIKNKALSLQVMINI